MALLTVRNLSDEVHRALRGVPPNNGPQHGSRKSEQSLKHRHAEGRVKLGSLLARSAAGRAD